MPLSPQNPHHRVPRQRPAVARALAYLDGLGDARSEKSIARMAYEAGVSYVSMWKAARSRPSPSPLTLRAARPAPAVTKRLSGMRVGKSIEEDLLHGRLPRHGAFPEIKELQVRYDAGFRTVKAALEDLRHGGLLERKGRSYLLMPRDRPAAPSLKIGVLAYNWDAERQFSLFSQYENDYVRDLELECWRRHIEVELLPYYHRGDRTIVMPLKAAGAPGPDWRKRFDGFIMIVVHVNCLQGDIAAQVHATGKPVVLLDEMSGWKTPDFLSKTGRALQLHGRPFRSAAETAGREIVARGHRHVAFFSAFHHDKWSQQCLEGLTAVIARAGGPDPKPFLEPGSQTDSGFDYTDRALASTVNRRIRNCYGECRKTMSAPYTVQLDPFFSAMFDEHLVYAETRDIMEKHLFAAADDRLITCWVAADADMARYVGDYLRAHRPDLSLVSFGSSPVVTRNRITTYDFNTPAAATASVEFLLYPQRMLPGQTGMELEIRGMMVDRGSLRSCAD